MKKKNQILSLTLFTFLTIWLTASCSLVNRINNVVLSQLDYVPDTTNFEHQTFEGFTTSRIEINGHADCYFFQIPEDEPMRIEVCASAKEMKSLTVKQEDNIIEIDFHQKEIRFEDKKPNYEKSIVKVFMPMLSTIKLDGMGRFNVGNLKMQNALRLSVNGIINANVDTLTCESFDLLIDGMASLKTKSLHADRFYCEIDGMCDMKVAGLKASSLTCSIDGMGDIIIDGTVASGSIVVDGMADVDVSNLRSETPLHIEKSGLANIKK